MKKYFLSLLLILSAVAGFSQSFQGVYSRSSNNLLSLWNPSVHHVWREDGNGNNYDYTAKFIVPDGYSITSWAMWERLDSTTTSVAFTGSGDQIHQGSMVYHSASLNNYDIYALAQRPGFPDIDAVWPGEVKVLPATFTQAQADLVIDVSSYGISNVNGSWTDRGASRYKVFLLNSKSGSGTFYGFNWRSDNDLNPVVFQFNNVTLSSTNKEMGLGPNRNVIFDGTADETVEYGLKLRKLPGGVAENLFITGSDGTHESDGLVFAGIDIDNGNSNQGGSGFVISTTEPASGLTTFNYATYSLDKLVVWRLKIRNTRDECLYLGHFDDFPHPTYVYPAITNADYSFLDVSMCGNECIQIGTHFGTDVYRSKFSYCGTRNQDLHRNGFQIAHGDRGFAFYMNEVEVNRKFYEWYTGQHGNVVEIFSNKMTNTGVGVVSGDANLPAGLPAFNGLIRVDQSLDNAYQYSAFFHNTIVTNGGRFVDFYLAAGSPTTIYNQFYFVNNLITTNTSTSFSVFNSFSSSWVVSNNLQYTSTSTPQFVNVANRDYHLTAGSPALAATTATWAKRRHRLADYDFEGKKFLTAHPAFGCYSAYELFDH